MVSHGDNRRGASETTDHGLHAIWLGVVAHGRLLTNCRQIIAAHIIVPEKRVGGVNVNFSGSFCFNAV